MLTSDLIERTMVLLAVKESSKTVLWTGISPLLYNVLRVVMTIPSTKMQWKRRLDLEKDHLRAHFLRPIKSLQEHKVLPCVPSIKKSWRACFSRSYALPSVSLLEWAVVMGTVFFLV